MECAGANRRRSGILSEFQRDESTEVCKTVESGWWHDENLQSYYEAQIAFEEAGDIAPHWKTKTAEDDDNQDLITRSLRRK